MIKIPKLKQVSFPIISAEIPATALTGWLIEYLPIATVIVRTMKDMESGNASAKPAKRQEY